METHVIPHAYSEPAPQGSGDPRNMTMIMVWFDNLSLAEEWLKQRKLADELAIELEDYDA